jgi:hypothetical protein
MSFTPKVFRKSNPPIRLVTEKPPAPHLSGLQPAGDMQPGEYTLSCVNAVYNRFKKQVVLDYAVIDGEHAGTALRQWINGVSENMSPYSHYAGQCALALGRDLAADENLDPALVFKGKLFRCKVGFRLSERPGGGRSDERFSLYKKDEKDRLKVLSILARVAL